MAIILQLLIICLLTGLAGQQAQAERPLQQHLGATVASVPGGVAQPELQELVSIVFQEGRQVISVCYVPR